MAKNDTKVTTSKKDRHRRQPAQNKALRRKKNEESASDDNSNSDSSESADEIDTHEYRKFLSKIFPSKHLNNKIKAGNRLKQKNVEEESSEEEVVVPKQKSRKKCVSESSEEPPLVKKHKKPKKIAVSESEESSEFEEDDDDETENDEPEEKKPNKYNIIFTFGGSKEWETDADDEYDDDEDWESYEDEDETDTDTEDEDEAVSSSNSENDSDEECDEEEPEIVHNKTKNKGKPNKSKNNEEGTPFNVDEANTFLSQLQEIHEKNKNNKIVQKCIDVCQEDIKNSKKKMSKKEIKQKKKNSRIFKKIIKDKNTMNDFSFFQKIQIDEQTKIIKELKEINKLTRIEKPYRMTLLESNMPILFKAAAMKKINLLRYMEPGSGEFYKIKNWVDTFMRMPFDKYLSLPISIEDGVDKCHAFMENSQKILNEAVYGLNDAKMQIMQMLGLLITNPRAIGTTIAIHGPPGTGKTSLVKEGISKILNRPFAFIALGGATDSSFLEGHSYTYEGSTWGKIVQIIIDSKCMNPVIYFDELDKISDTPKGEEIAGILTHLTDTSQNSQFHDKYFAEIEFDLSKCLFIFSYNDESKINPILKDRMYRIQTKGYNQKQKTVISNNYLLPKIKEQVKFTDEIIIPDETLHHIIDNFCNKEDGVRNLKRSLEIIYTKLNLYRLMKPDSNLFEEDMALKVEFPFTVTKNIADKLIKKEKENNTLYGLYV